MEDDGVILIVKHLGMSGASTVGAGTTMQDCCDPVENVVVGH